MAPAKPIVEKKRKYFTVDEANKALPLIKMIVGDIVRQYRIVEDLQQRLSRVAKERASVPRATSTQRSWRRVSRSSTARRRSCSRTLMS